MSARYPVVRLAVLMLSALVGPLSAQPAKFTRIVMLSGHGPEDAVDWDSFCTGGRNSGHWTKIPVPSCWEQQGFGTYNYGLQHRPLDLPDVGLSLLHAIPTMRNKFHAPDQLGPQSRPTELTGPVSGSVSFIFEHR